MGTFPENLKACRKHRHISQEAGRPRSPAGSKDVKFPSRTGSANHKVQKGSTMETLSKNLMILRKKRGLSRDAVSKAIGISAKTYERYEKNERNPDAPVLVKLAGFYGVTLDQLVGLAPLPDQEA